MGIIFPPGREFLKKQQNKNQLLTVVCFIVQRTGGEKLPLVFEEIRQHYDQIISFYFIYETWYFLIFPNTHPSRGQEGR